MEKHLFKNEPEDKRVAHLEANADTIENRSYYKKLSVEEIQLRKHEYTKASLEVEDLLEQKKDAMKEFKEQIDPIQKEIKKTGGEIRSGYSKEEGTLYAFLDRNTKMVHYYDEAGDLVPNESRPAMKEELAQLSIVSEARTGTH